ncbi:MAG: zinc-binding dehydrogenase [Paracoccaceae bacterium]
MPNTQVTLKQFGGTEQLELQTVEAPPTPKNGEVRVRVLVTSAAFTDVMIRKGAYPDVKEKPPFVQGYDLVGIVDALGQEVTSVHLGDRVADLTTKGAYSEYTCLPADRLTLIPEAVSDEDALAMILSAVTAYQMLHRVARLQEGQSLLINGAGGAVGTAMLQLAREAGVAAFGVDDKAKHDSIQSYGATAIDSGSADIDTAIRVIGEGVDAVFDPFGADSLSRSLQALKPGGILVAFGFMNEVLGRGGAIPLDFVKLKLWDWLPNGHATAFYSIGAMRRRHPEWFKEDLNKLFEMLDSGHFNPAIAEVMPLHEVRRAHARVEAGELRGKLVLRASAR